MAVALARIEELARPPLRAGRRQRRASRAPSPVEEVERRRVVASGAHGRPDQAVARGASASHREAASAVDLARGRPRDLRDRARSGAGARRPAAAGARARGAPRASTPSASRETTRTPNARSSGAAAASDHGRVLGDRRLDLLGAEDPVAGRQGEREPAADAELARSRRGSRRRRCGAAPRRRRETDRRRRGIRETRPARERRISPGSPGAHGAAVLADDRRPTGPAPGCRRIPRRRGRRHGLPGAEAGRLRHAVARPDGTPRSRSTRSAAAGVQRASAARSTRSAAGAPRRAASGTSALGSRTIVAPRPRRLPQRISCGPSRRRPRRRRQGVQSAAHERRGSAPATVRSPPGPRARSRPTARRRGPPPPGSRRERHGAARADAARGVEDRRARGRRRGGQARLAQRAQRGRSPRADGRRRRGRRARAAKKSTRKATGVAAVERDESRRLRPSSSARRSTAADELA